MASPHQLPPQVGDTTNLLLKKLVTATQGLGGSGGVFLTEAEADLLYFRLNGSNNPFTATSLTTATVRDGFSLESLGSLTFTTGANGNATIAPNGTGNVELLFNTISVAPAFRGLHITGVPATNTGFTVDTFGGLGIFNARRANGTVDAPTALVADDQILNFGARGYGATGYSVGSKGAFVIQATQNWTDAIQSTHARIDLTPRDTTVSYTALTFGQNRILAINENGSTVPFTNWTLSGAVLRIAPATYTNTTSSGTVAGLAMSSIGVQTVAATLASTYTNAANLYIAGDVTAGTNVTLTNSYGLWNVGASRFDGHILSSSTVNLGGTGSLVAISAANSVRSGALPEAWNGNYGVGVQYAGSSNNNIYFGDGTGGVLSFITRTGSANTTRMSIDATNGNLIVGGTITKPGGTSPLVSTNTAITSGAGASSGTLLNAPSAGNPTKWIPINDNGTTRYIPAW